MEASRFIAIDPGETTGICCWIDKECVGQYELSQATTRVKGELHFELFAYLVNYKPSVVILERFMSRPGQIKAVFTAIEYIGVVKYFCQASNTDLVLQTVAQAKGFWDDKKLRRVGLWHPTKDVRDATRHMLTYLQRTRATLVEPLLLKLR